jgi:AcrR family transcriptional regulator
MPSSVRRADAVRNRHRLVDAAREVFGEQGLDAPLDHIARRARLGNATLYRHFPTRCSLIAAVFAETLRDVLAAVEHALDEPDAWLGFTRHVRTLCGLQAGDRALANLLTATIEGAPELEQLRASALSGAVALIERAQRRGELRADFRHEDLVLLLMANAGLLERTADTAPDAWQRHLDYVLDGLRPTPTTASPSPGKAAVLAAMKAAAHRFGCGPMLEDSQDAARP